MIEKRTIQRRSPIGFMLIELLIVVGIITLLVSIMLPSFAKAKSLTRRTICAANLRYFYQAFEMYLNDNDDEYFPFMEMRPGGKLWYWGFEPAGGGYAEGDRPIDAKRAKLYPYFAHTGSEQICPEAPRISQHFKPKFRVAGYGYAINHCMLSDMGDKRSYSQLTRPRETIAWADSMQITTWPPASPSNPLLEDWYYLINRLSHSATFHFRHGKTCNAAFADGSVSQLFPFWLDPLCDGRVGRPEPPVPGKMVSFLLRIDK
ncbi:MAG: type II secretion system protein [Planctomycetota bacterium]|jgi:prepilin-type processing-associated H-X9-DG protein